MSLKAEKSFEIPEITAEVAQASFAKGNPYMKLRDELGTIFEDGDFLELYSNEGQPGIPAWRLALVTIMQFRENLPDRQAAEMVRARIDWKYLLGLELTDPGFDFSVLSEFRSRLLGGDVECLLDKMLERCQELELVKARGKQRTDATNVLAAIRVMNRLELVGETIRATLNELSTVAPEWVQDVVPHDWYKRYGRRIEDDRLPKSKEKRAAHAQTMGEDGFHLLTQLESPEIPAEWRESPMVQTLGVVLARHYEISQSVKDGEVTHQVRFKENRELERAAKGIESPYDPDARYRSRYGSAWTGYIAHLTETCEEDELHLVTHVETTEATVHEVQKTETIHQALVDKKLPPREHIVDSAYVDAELLVDSRKNHGISLIGPTRPNPSWQSQLENGYDVDKFTIDWEKQQVRCPEGNLSTSWREDVDHAGSPLIRALFSVTDCKSCPARELCTRAPKRVVGFQPKEQYEALRQARQRHASPEGQQLYNRRAGIEGTLSQGVRAFGLRFCRYRGLAKTHLQHVATAAAINIDRLFAWFEHIPQAKTRTSRFARLAPA